MLKALLLKHLNMVGKLLKKVVQRLEDISSNYLWSAHSWQNLERNLNLKLALALARTLALQALVNFYR